MALLLTSVGVMAVSAKKDEPEEEPIRVTIDNKSDKPAYLKLTGPHFYYFTAGAQTKSTWTPLSGEYEYLLVACGIHYKTGKLDLQKPITYVVPICGMNSFRQIEGKSEVDVGRELKLVRMTFTGRAYGTLVLVLRGPSTYVMALPHNVDKVYTIRRGWYEYTLYGCGSTEGGKFYAESGKHKKFYCP